MLDARIGVVRYVGEAAAARGVHRIRHTMLPSLFLLYDPGVDVAGGEVAEAASS